MEKYYRVQYLDNDTWTEHSTHRNEFYAEVQFDLLNKQNKHTRIVYEGKVVKEAKHA